MKTVNRTRIAMAASVVLGLAAMSSSASAQLTQEQMCRIVANQICGYDEWGDPIYPTFPCTLEQYEICMDSVATADVKKLDGVEERRNVQLASLAAPTARRR